jgi:hypothetical protein
VNRLTTATATGNSTYSLSFGYTGDGDSGIMGERQNHPDGWRKLDFGSSQRRAGPAAKPVAWVEGRRVLRRARDWIRETKNF